MQIIGHRGAKGLASQNTVQSVQRALQQHVDWIEIDVRRTKDNQLVVIHDMTLLRVAGRLQLVKDMTLAQLQKIDDGKAAPTFTEVMQAIGRAAKVNIELKESGCAKAVVAEINRQVRSGRSYDDFLVSSLFVKHLRQAHRLDPRIPLGYIQTLWPFAFLSIQSVPLRAVGFFGLAAPKVAIALAKRRGLWTYVYTVNHRVVTQHFQKIGVDAIITDRPGALLPLWPTVLGAAAGIALVFLVGYVMWLWMG